MDSCRIGWGTVLNEQTNSHPEKSKGSLLVKTKPLIIQDGTLTLGTPITKKINVPMADDRSLTSNLVTFHWDTLCGTITEQQARQLEYYTNQAITLANQTL
jgi:hypothetical protein